MSEHDLLCVKAEKLLHERGLDKEYAGILGYENFCQEAYKLAFGEDQSFRENQVSLTMLHDLACDPVVYQSFYYFTHLHFLLFIDC